MGASCKVLSADNADSLRASEGLVPCHTSGLLPVKSFKEVKHSAAALLSAYCTQAFLIALPYISFISLVEGGSAFIGTILG